MRPAAQSSAKEKAKHARAIAIAARSYMPSSNPARAKGGLRARALGLRVL
jgi:hypothetical protein